MGAGRAPPVTLRTLVGGNDSRTLYMGNVNVYCTCFAGMKYNPKERLELKYIVCSN